MAAQVRIGIVDPREIRRRGLCCLLKGQPGVRVVGDVGDRNDAQRLIARKHPAVLVVRWDAAEGWSEMLSSLVRASPPTPVLLLAVEPLSRSPLLKRAVDLGARGFVFDHQRLGVLMQAIWAVASGERWRPARVLSRELSQQALAGRSGVLTCRERQVTTLVGEGKGNKQIARSLAIALGTVKNHLTSIFRKLGVSSRAALVAHTYRHGLLTVQGRQLPSTRDSKPT